MDRTPSIGLSGFAVLANHIQENRVTTATYPVTAQNAAAFDPRDPKPGIYRGVPDEMYFSARAVNHSTLLHMGQTPAHFRDAFECPMHRESDAMRLGSLAHMMLFQPSRLTQSIVPAPINPRTQAAFGSDTKAWADYAAENAGKLIVSDDEVMIARGMVDAILSHPNLGTIFNAATDTEVVIVWDDYGILCKAKIDAMVGTMMAGDLKTTDDASERAFAAKMVSYSYITQSAFYTRGLRALGLDGMDFVFGVVEKPAKSETAEFLRSGRKCKAVAYMIGENTAAAGRAMVCDWLSHVSKCRALKEWPGYTSEIVQIEAPTYFLAKFADGNV